jgi:predicted ATPase
VRAQALCEQLNLDVSPEYFDVLYGLRRIYTHHGLFADAQNVSEHCLRIAQDLRDSSRLRASNYSLGITLYQRGDVQTALSYLEQGMIHKRQDFQTSIALGGRIPSCHMTSSWALWACGFADQAHQRSLETLALVDKVERPFAKAWTLALLAQLAHYRRELGLMYEWADMAWQLATERNFPQVLGWATTYRGWAVAMQGRLEEGYVQVRQGMDAVLASGSVSSRPYYLALLAEIQWKMGKIDAALQSIEEALKMVANTGERWYEAELRRLKGELLLQQSLDNHPEAETCFHQALNVARHQQAKSLELRAATSLAKLWHSQGRYQDAYDLLAPVYGWFTEGFDTVDLQDAKALLDALS